MSPKDASLAALAIALAVLSACSAPTRDVPIVVISIDTLRSDRLPAYGFTGVETPAIDALAADGVVFERAYAHVPLTLPSHASLFTGVLPPAHGVRDNAGYRFRGDELPSLPRALRDRGYATGAAVSSFVLRADTGIDHGFDTYDDAIEFRTGTGIGGLQRPGEETLERAFAWLDGVADPFFLFLHLYEPHTPYTPPPPFAGRFEHPYLGEIAEADRVVGRLVERLKADGTYDDSLIVVLSDHGESLGEHGEPEHGVLVYREALQVPLIVKLPGGERAGSRDATPVQLADVYPTIADVVGLEADHRWIGASILDTAAIDPDRVLYAESYYPRLHFGWSELVSLLSGSWHYIEGTERELFDVVRDPAELDDVLERERDVHTRLAASSRSIDRAFERPTAEDAETSTRLAALGYVGSSAPEGDGPLPDPRSQTAVLGELREGFAAFSRGDHDGAVATLTPIVARYPLLLDAWDCIGRAHIRAGRDREALAAYREALRHSGGSPLLALSAAKLFLRAGDHDQAAAHAELGLDLEPSVARSLLAQVAKRRGRLDEALDLATRAHREKPDRLGPILTLADVEAARGDYEGALARLDTVRGLYDARENEDPELVRGMHVLYGETYANLGRIGEAELAFRREIELFPQDVRAYSRLALLYALGGRPDAVAPVLQSMLAARPEADTYAEAVRTLRALGDPASATRLFEVARRKFPGDPALDGLAEG